MTEHLARWIGGKLRSIRLQGQLSLREVEERSLRFAQERHNQSYQISASWLNRLEWEEHELTINKLIILADIYNLRPAADRLHVSRRCPTAVLRQRSSSNATMLLTEGPPGRPSKVFTSGCARYRPTPGRDHAACGGEQLPPGPHIGEASSGSAIAPWIP
jgi:hypothetical protein